MTSCWNAAQLCLFDLVILVGFALAHKNRLFNFVWQLSLVAFCVFRKSAEATEGSRVQKVSTPNSSIAETNFRILAGFTEGSQGSQEWYMEAKNQWFCVFFTKKSCLQAFPSPAFFSISFRCEKMFLEAALHHLFLFTTFVFSCFFEVLMSLV